MTLNRATKFGCYAMPMARIIGHNQAIETLQIANENQRLHHAWIISGPLGVGKCTLAKEMGRVLLDPEVSNHSLGKEVLLTEETNTNHGVGYHPDLHIVHRSIAAHSSNPQLRERKQINIPIDLLRETMIGGRTSDNRMHEAKAYLTASMGGSKVFIVDESERLDLAGQNALLKTLEEPPQNTYFFLITARPERLLPTILSRCQHLRLAPLTKDQMLEWAVDRGLDPQSSNVMKAIEFSEGSPGLAELAIQREMTGWIDSIHSLMNQLHQGQWTIDSSNICVDFVDSWAESVIKENPKASKDGANRDGIEMLLRILTTKIRRQMRVTQTRNEFFYWCQLIDRIAETESQVSAGLNLKHVLEALVVEWQEPAVC